jgi:hypothetical protein
LFASLHAHAIAASCRGNDAQSHCLSANKEHSTMHVQKGPP